jgi:hypothetical protein
LTALSAEAAIQHYPLFKVIGRRDVMGRETPARRHPRRQRPLARKR